MTIAHTNRNGRGPLGRFRRQQTWLEISGYHVGDVQSENPVAILSGATLVGNVFAPVISINGLLYGAAVARQATIEPEGQVWSDIYTISLTIEPGGKIQGWVSTLDEETYQNLQKNRDLDGSTIPELPGNAPEGSRLVRSEAEIDTLRLLQAETATALAARIELEHTFDKRLAEIAGETAAKARSLDKSLTEAQGTLTTVQQQLEETTVQLHSREQEVEQQAHELGVTRELIANQQEELEQLQQAHEQNLLEFSDLQSAKAAVDQELHDALQEIETLNGRVHSLETALQASLQHTAELEESLVRWQELAETTETKANDLQKELDKIRYELQEQERMAEMLRGQRQQAEDQWQKTSDDLQNLRQQLSNLEQEQILLLSDKEVAKAEIEEKAQISEALQEKVTQLEAELAQMKELEQEVAQITADKNATAARVQEKEQTITTLQSRIAEQDAALADKATAIARLQEDFDELTRTHSMAANALGSKDQTISSLKKQLRSSEEELTAAKTARDAAQAELQDKLQGSIERMRGLEQALASAQEQASTSREQLTWHKANLQSTRVELEESRQLVQQQKTAVADLRQQLAVKNQEAAQWEQDKRDHENRLQTQTARLNNLKKELKVVHQEAVREKKELQGQLRNVQLQMEANETELNRHIKEAGAQGRHLADIQSILIEREIELQQAQAKINKQAEFIQQMKEVTTQRINTLKGQLAQARQLIQQSRNK